MKTAWVELNAVGWWLGADKPEDLQKIETRARSFLAHVKGGKDGREDLKRCFGYIEIEDGMMLKGGKELLPLVFIPPETGGAWPQLGKLLLEQIESAANDLFGVYDAGKTEFYSRWLSLAGYKELADDIAAVSAKRDG
jgi:hypothetical protein